MAKGARRKGRRSQGSSRAWTVRAAAALVPLLVVIAFVVLRGSSGAVSARERCE